MDLVLVQMDVEFGNVETNLQTLTNVIEDLSPGPDTLIAVPELFVTGYHGESINQVAGDVETGNLTIEIKDICEQYGITLYGSIPTKDHDQIFNTAILINEEGLISSYKKSHLFGPMGEKELFGPGREVITTEYKGIIYGLSICYDLRFPELYQAQCRNGATLLLICAEWPITRVEHWRALARARAIENQAFVVAVNRVGSDPEYTYGGHSVIYSPFGEEIVGLNHAEEEVIEKQLDLKEIQLFRDKFDVRQDKWLK